MVHIINIILTTYLISEKPLHPHTRQALYFVKHSSRHILFGILATFLPLLLLTSCSTKKNTGATHFWQSFNTRFNVYFNGSEAYKAGLEEKEKGNKDNYTETLPLFPVGNEKSKTLGKSNFETAITKCQKAIQLHSIKRRPIVKGNKRKSPKMKAYLSRKEFNPFLKNAWLLMGKAQFQKGDFLEAAATFSYIARQYAAEPLVAAEARIWLARCYTQEDWFYDAEDALKRAGRDSLTARLQREQTVSMANLLLKQGRLEEALPYLRQTARWERRKAQRARLYFLLAQVETSLGHAQAAYKAYGKCLRQSPPYETAFNARIRQTEVVATGRNAQKMLKRLRRMARSANNAEYLDQVYYAIGNIHLAAADTANAVKAYETGRTKAKRAGVEKGVLLLKLGGVYWDLGAYDKAQTCYAEAIGLIDKTYPGYEDITRRSTVLDELVPYTSAVHLQDSLLLLSTMPEAQRNEAIDRVIKDLKHREELERRSKADSIAEARRSENDGNVGGGNAGGNRNNNSQQPNSQNAQTWYFYNPTMVNQGKLDFQKRWGRRKNEDNWRRSNRTVLATAESDEYDYAADDSISNANASTEVADSTAAADSIAEDPHTREFYLKQIPFTPEAKTACHDIIKDGLYNAGLIEKDKLEDFPLAAKTLKRLQREYPEFEKMADVYYQLFLLYSRWNKPAEADAYRALMAQHYPDDAMTRLINDPDFERNARFGKAIEDSLYTATYEAYCQHQTDVVARNFAVSTNKFPNGANRPKFIFVHALSQIGHADNKDIMAELRELVSKYPDSDVSEMAGLLVKGLESGRLLTGDGTGLGSLWSHRSAEANAAVDEAGHRKELTTDKDVPFICIVAYPTGSLPDGQVLYDLAHFNFTGFKVRNFDIAQVRDPQITQLRVAGFNSFAEAHLYAQQLFADARFAADMKKARLVIISASNAELLGTTYSFDDYQKFYDQHFAPLKLAPQLPLDLQEGPVEQHYEDEYTPEELEQMNGKKTDTDDSDDDGEWYSPS